jgi:malonyl-CoA/methylmalonyl-CoA synthetase
VADSLAAVLFPALVRADATATVRVADDEITYPALAAATAAAASTIAPGARVAVVVERHLATIVGILAVLRAGGVAIPVNPSATDHELAHVLDNSTPTLVLHAPDHVLATRLSAIEHRAIAIDATGHDAPHLDPALDDSPALVMYTSGTTGPPKGAVLSRAAVAANLDALAEAWAWTAADRLVHSLPLYHVHGLVLGVLGPLRVGGSLHHTGRFDPHTTAAALRDGGTMHFGVPTMYARLADAAESGDASSAGVAHALRNARLLVSGSAGLPRTVHDRIERATGHVVVERYGMTETMITTAVPAGRRDKAGTVGPALPGVQLRLVDDGGADVADDGEVMGEIWARTPSMFTGYLNDPEATAAALADGWMVTGDIATRDADGYLRIVGRRSTDIIKSGGFKIGAGEVEDCLLGHPDVAEAAVKGLPDDDLGERVVAWVVAAPGTTIDTDAVARHAAEILVTHKRPRDIHVVGSLPRNAMGKVQKSRLTDPAIDGRS